MSTNTNRRQSEERRRTRDKSQAGQNPPSDHAALAMAADLHTVTQITQIWSDRLQLISVYSSFFTSIDSLLFSLASNRDRHNTASKVMISSLVGALIFHASSAILAYVSSFVLIRYKLNGGQSASGSSSSPIATIHNNYANSGKASSDQPRTPSALESGPREKAEGPHIAHALTHSPTPFVFGRPQFISSLTAGLASLLEEPPVFKIDLRRVSLFEFSALVPCVARDNDPKADAEKNVNALMRLLGRCHLVCTVFALSGFLMLLTGIIVYIWAVLERVVAIFGSACVGVCIILGVAALQ
ncbi:hypothetical protein F5148DRAFT_1200016 [Russula earlei]|uniref:Uncharacterized protein n=1 Tax=Russula earlei TaxID=71964 RepID=A0ACC0U8E3_9AGAM|nr:hypothetical protein F5148DRAFT_1200016 [Russula earlei]